MKLLPSQSLKTRVTFYTLAIFLVCIGSLAFYASYMLRQDMQRLLGEQQFSTVSLMASEVNQQLDERLRGLESVAAKMSPAILGNSAALQAFLEDRPVLMVQFNGGIAALGPDGTVIADVPLSAGRIGVNYMDVDGASAAALRAGKSTIGRPVMGKKLKTPVFVMVVPVRDAQDRVVGALAGVINLGKPNFLDKITENTYGKSGGYLLIAPQYRLIVTASDKSRIMATLPAPGSNAMMDRYTQGYEGTDIFINPVGVEVLASVKGVPVAGWYVAVALPTAEAFAPIRTMQQRILLSTIILTLLAGVLVWFMLRRQFSPMLAAARTLATLSDTNRSVPTLPITRQDEIGELIGGFNRLLETLAQREEVLRETKRFVKESQSIAGLGSFVLDISTGVWKSSDVFDRVFGIGPAYERSLEGWVALIHPDDRTMMADYLGGEILGQHQAFDKEHRIIRHDDRSARWVHGLGKLEFDALGRPLNLRGTIQDITVRKQISRALQESKQQYDKLAAKIPVGIYILSSTPQGTFALDYASPRFAEIFNLSVSSLMADANAVLLAIHPDDAAGFAKLNQDGIQHRRPFDWKGRILRDGMVRWLHIMSSPEALASGDVLWHGMVVDITERRQAEEKLQLAASVFSHTREGIVITEPDGTIIDVNEAFSRITGYSRDEVLGRDPRLLSSGRQGKEFYAAMWQDLMAQGHWYGEIWNRRKNGEVYAEMLTISAVRDAQGNARHYVALFSDITALKAHQSQLERSAHYDALTGLPNRVLLADRLHQGMVQAQRHGQLLAVAYLDLDGFKAINDQHGHAAGDQLLVAVASSMKQALREGDTLARLGGDEFVAVLLDLADIETSVPTLTRLLAAAAQSVQFGEHRLQVSASLGVTFYPQAQDVDADQLLRQADQAMYQAKLTGRNRYQVFGA